MWVWTVMILASFAILGVQCKPKKEANPFVNPDNNDVDSEGYEFCKNHMDQKAYTYMVTIWHKTKKEERVDRTLIAGGSMITSKHVITSYSAIEKFNGSWSELEVYAGRCNQHSHIRSVRISSEKSCVSKYEIERVIGIQAYWVIGNLHDIAIIYLQSNVNPNHASTLCIAKQKLVRVNSRSAGTNTAYQVLGWGRIDDYGMALAKDDYGNIEVESCNTFLESQVKSYCHNEAFKYLNSSRKVEHLEKWGTKNPRNICLMIREGSNACSYYTKGAPIISQKEYDGRNGNKYTLLGISIYSLKCENMLLATDATTYINFIKRTVQETTKSSRRDLTTGLCECDESDCEDVRM